MYSIGKHSELTQNRRDWYYSGKIKNADSSRAVWCNIFSVILIFGGLAAAGYGFYKFYFSMAPQHANNLDLKNIFRIAGVACISAAVIITFYGIVECTIAATKNSMLKKSSDSR